MVDEDAHRLIIRVTEALCSQVDSICLLDSGKCDDCLQRS
jgi:hypothetical protein